jgi:hypothetical protein
MGTFFNGFHNLHMGNPIGGFRGFMIHPI